MIKSLGAEFSYAAAHKTKQVSHYFFNKNGGKFKQKIHKPKNVKSGRCFLQDSTNFNHFEEFQKLPQELQIKNLKLTV